MVWCNIARYLPVAFQVAVASVIAAATTVLLKYAASSF